MTTGRKISIIPLFSLLFVGTILLLVSCQEEAPTPETVRQPQIEPTDPASGATDTAQATNVIEPTTTAEPLVSSAPTENAAVTAATEPSQEVEPTETAETGAEAEPTQTAETAEEAESTEEVEATTAVEPAETAEPSLSALQNANLRAGPGTNYEVVGILMSEQSADITGKNATNTWWQISRQEGAAQAWIAASVVQVQGSTDEVPVVNVALPEPTSSPVPTADTSDVEIVEYEVYDCEHIGGSRFRWYSAIVEYVDGVATREEITGGPFEGYWQNRCPPLPPSPEEATPCGAYGCDWGSYPNNALQQAYLILGWFGLSLLAGLLIVLPRTENGEDNDRKG